MTFCLFIWWPIVNYLRKFDKKEFRKKNKNSLSCRSNLHAVDIIIIIIIIIVVVISIPNLFYCSK